MTSAEWARFTRRYRELLGGARAVVLSGSLPPGVPADAYGVLVALARAAGVPALLDADGEALLAALPRGPTSSSRTSTNSPRSPASRTRRWARPL